VHATHEPAPASALPVQTGVVPPHCVDEVHDATHLSVAALHTWPVVQAVGSVCVHCTHAAGKSVVSQAGVVPLQGLSVAVHATHVFVVVSHTVPRRDTGPASPLQLASLRQPTQVLVVVSQTGVAPTQAVVLPVMHCTQVLVVVSQTGVSPTQAVAFPAPAAHCTQVFEVLQTGVATLAVLRVPVQSALSPLMHCTQTPALQWVKPPVVHWVSFVQPISQVFVLALHTPDSQLAPAVHCTQVFVAGLQTGVVPVQAPGSAVVHATHVCVVVLHTVPLALTGPASPLQ
jgi:hypothetical protein